LEFQSYPVILFTFYCVLFTCSQFDMCDNVPCREMISPRPRLRLLLQELELKIRQFETLLRAPAALADAPNLNALWAGLLVEELCRQGCSTFCIAPGAPPAGFRVGP